MMTELQELLDAVNGEIYGVWFLIGAALVFWMQAGFAMVEAGFTRAKNTGNIIMKNLMDFCIGTCTFILIGFGLLLGEDLMGLIGKPGFDIFTNYADFDWSNFVFNLVFCATRAISQKSTLFPDITSRSAHWGYLSCGLAGMDLTVRRQRVSQSLALSL